MRNIAVIGNIKMKENKKTIIRIGNRNPKISLEKALNKVYPILVTKRFNKKGEGRLQLVISVPQILIGHKVKLVLAD